MTQLSTADQIELFIQGEGIPKITLLKVNPKDTVADLIKIAREHGLSTPEGEEVCIFIEDTDTPLALEVKIDETGLSSRSRVHIHRCQRLEVTVNFNKDQLKGFFPPSVTVAWVKKWVVSEDGFGMSDVDAAEHLLQVCGSAVRPDEDAHIGTLTKGADQSICFDLVAKKRVEG